jgi:sugar phosphate permease
MSEDRVFAKCAWRLIPFMVLLYVVSFIDRSNVTYAALTMNKDLAVTPIALGFQGSSMALRDARIQPIVATRPDRRCSGHRVYTRPNGWRAGA